MKFLREIPIERLTDIIVNDLTNYGFVLVWKESSIEIWADCRI